MIAENFKQTVIKNYSKEIVVEKLMAEYKK